MLLPPHISMNYYQMKFRLIKAQHFPSMDTFGSTEAYVKVTYLGRTIQTKAVKQRHDEVYWAQEIWIPVQAPLVSGRIVMTVHDHDVGRVDDDIGAISFDIAKILQASEESDEFPWYWNDVYGSALGVSGKNTNIMNRMPEKASHWKGRILMQVGVEKTERPEMKLNRVDEDILAEAGDKFSNWTYEVKAEVLQGICLPDAKLKVKIKIGEFELTTKKPKIKEKGYCFWNKRFKDETFDVPYRSIEDMADVFVYIMDGSSPI